MKKLLVFSLNRTGSLPIYADSLIYPFGAEEYDLYTSKFSTYKNKSPHNMMKTYNTNFEFLMNTFIYLPFFLLKNTLKFKKQYYAVLLPYYHLWNLILSIYFKMLGLPIIWIEHDGIFHKGEGGFIKQRLNDFNIKLTNKIIFLTKNVQQIMTQRLNIKQPTKVLPHGIIENKYIKERTEFNAKPNLLFFGRISKYKGVENLYEAVKAIDENTYNTLTIAGKSNYAIKIPSTNKIKFLDQYLDDKEVAELINNADILILPYQEASQSGVIALAIQAGIPMICTNVGGLNEQLEPEECLWVAPDTDSIQKGIEHLLKHTELLPIYSNRLKDKRKNLQWDQISKGLKDFIEI